MYLENDIVYNTEEYIAEIEKKLDKLNLYRYDSKYRALLGNKFVDTLSEWDANVRKRKGDPYTIVVCGEFKRGKSSFINAWLGEEVVTTNVVTETITLNKLSYGTHSNEIVLPGGKRLPVSDEDMQRSRLEEIIKKTGENIVQIEVKRPLEILKDITIIDTPGINDALKDFSDLLNAAISQADAVIYMFSVNSPLSELEQLFLKSVIIPQNYTSLFIVGNYADVLVNRENYIKMKEYIEQKTRSLLPEQEIYIISALDERCRQIGAKRPAEDISGLTEENFAKLKGEIERQIELRKDYVIPERMQRVTKMMAQTLEENLAALEKGLEMNSEDIQRAVDTVKRNKEENLFELKDINDKISDTIKMMRAETAEIIHLLIQKMREEADELEKFDVDDIIKNYTFYCIETLQSALGICIDRHTDIIMDEVDDIVGKMASDIYSKGENKKYGFKFALDTKVWTKGDTVATVGDFIGLGGIVLGIAGGLMRKKEMKNKKPDVIKNIKAQYPEFENAANRAIEQTYDELEKKLKNQLSVYYGEQINALEEQLEQSNLVARQDDEKKKEIKCAIDEIKAIVAIL